MPDPTPVDDLRAHVDAAYAAADRVVREAQERAQAADRRTGPEPPPRGWDVADEHRPPPRASAAADLQAVVGLLDQLRHAIPPEISAQLAEAMRELLLAVRALIDWYLERLDRGDAGSAPSAGERVEDIPIA